MGSQLILNVALSLLAFTSFFMWHLNVKVAMQFWHMRISPIVGMHIKKADRTTWIS